MHVCFLIYIIMSLSAYNWRFCVSRMRLLLFRSCDSNLICSEAVFSRQSPQTCAYGPATDSNGIVYMRMLQMNDWQVPYQLEDHVTGLAFLLDRGESS